VYPGTRQPGPRCWDPEGERSRPPNQLPLREDLQAGTVNGLPPFFIRNGTGGNEWLPVTYPQPGQAVPYEILPYEEMPQIVNPPAGFFVNANNDPAGTSLDNDVLNQLRPGGGIYYLNAGYDGIRGGRITALIRAELAGDGSVSFADSQRIQADTALVDAQFFVPYLVKALARGALDSDPTLRGLARDRAVAEAVGRLALWNRRTPTGIAAGYDASDVDGGRLPPTRLEQANSAARPSTRSGAARSSRAPSTPGWPRPGCRCPTASGP
jgi:penicillin amidase